LACDRPRRRDNDHLRGYDGGIAGGVEVRWNPGSCEVYKYDTATGEVEVLGLVSRFVDGTPLALHPDHVRHEALARHAPAVADRHGLRLYFAGRRHEELEFAFGRPVAYDERGTVWCDLFTPSSTEGIDAVLEDFLRTRSPDKVELDPDSEWSRAAQMAWEDALGWQHDQDELETRGEYDDFGPDDRYLADTARGRLDMTFDEWDHARLHPRWGDYLRSIPDGSRKAPPFRSWLAEVFSREGAPPFLSRPDQLLPDGWVVGDPNADQGSTARLAYDPRRHAVIRCPGKVAESTVGLLRAAGFERLDLPAGDTFFVRDRIRQTAAAPPPGRRASPSRSR
jgi:hypothetical protein